MSNDTDPPEGSSKSVTEWIEDALGIRLPKMPQIVRNLNKAGAALLDIPIARWETQARATRGSAARREKIEDALTKAMVERLGKAAPEEIARRLDGMVLDYLTRHENRAGVLELTASELEAAPPKEDAKEFISGDWMAFFKGKVDALGTEEGRLLFARVLAGEIKQPGSFSKRALSALAEMDQRTARLFESLCNMSWRIGDAVLVLSRPSTPGEINPLSQFGLSIFDLNDLSDAGLIVADYFGKKDISGLMVGVPFEIGGAWFVFERRTDGVPFETNLDYPNGVGFTTTGRELRSIVALKPNPHYISWVAERHGRSLKPHPNQSD